MRKLLELPKEYVAELELGTETDTLDATGIIIKERSIPTLTTKILHESFKNFKGEITQRIPDYSAAKIGGQRMYKLARKGIKIPDKFKSIKIYQLNLISYTTTRVSFQVLCSYGTYIRTLGADIAKSLGTVGFLRTLTRTAIGNYKLEDSIEIHNFPNKWIDLHRNENI
jgi:tRNA pseudouridine55 synthase